MSYLDEINESISFDVISDDDLLKINQEVEFNVLRLIYFIVITKIRYLGQDVDFFDLETISMLERKKMTSFQIFIIFYQSIQITKNTKRPYMLATADRFYDNKVRTYIETSEQHQKFLTYNESLGEIELKPNEWIVDYLKM